METKKFTVVDTRTGLVKTFDSNATTLRELKADLYNLGINTDGMSIQEGLTRITFESDDSLLPHDVEYRGTVTNNLVFRITQNDKKYKSGIDRKEIYDLIKKLHLAEAIKEAFGRNFTQVSTDELKKIVYDAESKVEVKDEAAKDNKSDVTLIGVAKVLNALLNVLFQNDTINCEDIDFIAKSSGQHFTVYADDEKGGNNSIYSNAELNEMFEDM